MVKVKAHTRKTKNGKTVRVKAHARSNPNNASEGRNVKIKAEKRRKAINAIRELVESSRLGLPVSHKIPTSKLFRHEDTDVYYLPLNTGSQVSVVEMISEKLLDDKLNHLKDQLENPIGLKKGYVERIPQMVTNLEEVKSQRRLSFIHQNKRLFPHRVLKGFVYERGSLSTKFWGVTPERAKIWEVW